MFLQLLTGEYRRETVFGQRFASAKSPATTFLSAFLVCVYVFQWCCGATDLTPMLVQVGALEASRLALGEWWRLASSTVLHAGSLHLVSNLLLIFVVGRFLERLLGSSRYLLLYCLSALVGAMASAIPAGAPSVGASGAGYGLLAALLVITQLRPWILPADARKSAASTVLWLCVLNAAASLLPSVDVWGHLGGALTGGALMGSGLLLLGVPKADSEDHRREMWWPTMALPLTAAYAGAALFGVVRERPWLHGQVPKFVPVALGKQRPMLPSFLPPPNVLPSVDGDQRSYLFGDGYAPYGLQLTVRAPAAAADLEGAWAQIHRAWQGQLLTLLRGRYGVQDLQLAKTERLSDRFITCARGQSNGGAVTHQSCVLTMHELEAVIEGHYLNAVNPEGHRDVAYEIARRW